MGCYTYRMTKDVRKGLINGCDVVRYEYLEKTGDARRAYWRGNTDHYYERKVDYAVAAKEEIDAPYYVMCDGFNKIGEQRWIRCSSGLGADAREYEYLDKGYPVYARTRQGSAGIPGLTPAVFVDDTECEFHQLVGYLYRTGPRTLKFTSDTSCVEREVGEAA